MAVAYVISDYQNFKFLISSRIGKANAHYHTKFHQNRSNCCRVITFNGI